MDPWNIFVGALSPDDQGEPLGCGPLLEWLGGVGWVRYPKLACGHCVGCKLSGAVSAPLVGLLAYARTYGVILHKFNARYL